jgi:hypothetical protein
MTTSPKRALARETLRGTLRVEREGSLERIFEVSFRHTEPGGGARQHSNLLRGAAALVALLDRLRVDFGHPEVKQALEDLLQYGSAILPDLNFSSAEL